MRLFVTSPTTGLSGEVSIPRSKYHEHRALVLASLAEGTSQITGASGSRHVGFTRSLLRGLNTRIAPTSGGFAVTGGTYSPHRGTVSVGSSGTTLYFMLGLACLSDAPVTFTGQKYFQRRPIGPLLGALRDLGVRLDSADDKLPVTVHPGRPRGGTVRISGELSQWLSGLLLLAPFATSPTVIEVDGELNERPYIDLTIREMAKFGLRVHASPDRRRFEIEPGQVARAAEITLPPDLGSAAFGLAAAALHESDVLFSGLPTICSSEVDHPEADFLSVLTRMGVSMRADPAGRGIRVQHDGRPLTPFDADCRDMPDMLPVLVSLACFAEGTSTLANVGHARLKESDRVRSMALQVSRLGGRIEERGDLLLVYGMNPLRGAELSSFNDHRVQMALAVAASRADGRSSITNATAHRLSYPSFVRDMTRIGIPMSVGPAGGRGSLPAQRSAGRSTIVDRVAELAATRPDEPAVIDLRQTQERWTNWARLNDEANRLAGFLTEIGVGVGDKVAYQLPNWSEFVTITLATLRVGAVCVPLMPIFREREQTQTLNQSGARVLFIPATFRDRGYRAEIHSLAQKGSVPALRHVVVVAATGGGALVGEDSLRWHDFSDVLAGAPADPPRSAATPDLTAQLLFTSGTTGEPKGVLHRHRSLELAAEAQIRHVGLGSDDVVYIPSPLAHQTGFLYGMWLALSLGVPQVLQAEWDAAVAADAIERFRVTFVQAATPFLADLLAVSERTGHPRRGPRIFVVTGAAVPRALAERARVHWQTSVGGAWGTTETCLGTSFAPDDPQHKQWGTDGRALDKVEMRVTDDDGRALGPGAEGSLEVRGETVFDGYLDRPDLTAAAFAAHGWYRTGDLAVIDDDGYLRITGRLRDIINRGGEKVPVAEVEQLLHEHPSVAETAVVAMPDERLGERACAYVVPRPGCELGFEAMRKYLESRHIAKTYWPERLEIIDALPRNPSGKVKKNELRDRIRVVLSGERKESH
jgi:cyclohexanecarboxylate-CoA ligase